MFDKTDVDVSCTLFAEALVDSVLIDGVLDDGIDGGLDGGLDG